MSSADRSSGPQGTGSGRAPVVGRRRRRLRRTIQVLVVLAVVAAAVGFFAYRASRPEVRRPGEDLEDITHNLAASVPEDAPRPVFVDVTVEAGLGDFRTFRGRRTSQLPEDMGTGLAWGDFDNDGDDDLFVVAAGGPLGTAVEEWADSRLYENQGDGTFARVEDFPQLKIIGMGAAWGDMDGDGWLDLAVSGYRSLLLYRNRQGRLERDESFEVREGYWAGVAWADFDNDLDLDLYVCGYVRYEEDSAAGRQASEQYGTAVPYTLNPASFEPELNLLLQNDGSGRFEDVAVLYGVANPEGRTLSALWHDFDEDGRLDLYLANDISDNALYLNRGETFDDVGLAAWVADYRGAMGLTAGDWNRDGDDDLFVTHWIAQENALYDSRLVDFQRTQGEGDAAGPARLAFSDLAAPLGLGEIALHSVGWGTAFLDLESDGWLDLVVSNGSTMEEREDPSQLKPQPAMLLWNERGRRFHDLAPASPPFAQARVGRGLATADYDGDGDLDVASIDLAGGVHLLRNDTSNGNGLEIRLVSRGSGEELTGRGEGARVIAWVGDVPLRRTVSSASYLSQGSLRLHFGLGEATGADRVEVRWRGEEVQEFGRLEAGKVWRLTEGEPDPVEVVVGPVASRASERERVVAFWKYQRAAMDAMKITHDPAAAAGLFRQALALDPEHEDSHYYLAAALVSLGRTDEALDELELLLEINPTSHRGHKQWALLTVLTAEGPADLAAAEAALERAVEINAEETGGLQALAEVSLLRGNYEVARQRLEWVSRTNSRSVGSLYLQGYLAWREGDTERAVSFLETAAEARGPDWKPEGAVAEGDVAAQMHKDASPLSEIWQAWEGNTDPTTAYAPLERHLAAQNR